MGRAFWSSRNGIYHQKTDYLTSSVPICISFPLSNCFGSSSIVLNRNSGHGHPYSDLNLFFNLFQIVVHTECIYTF